MRTFIVQLTIRYVESVCRLCQKKQTLARVWQKIHHQNTLGNLLDPIWASYLGM